MIDELKMKLFAGSDGEGEGDPKGEDNNKPEPSDKPKHPTDEEARLLKEVMAKKEALKAREGEIAELKKQMAEFEALGGFEQMKKWADEAKALAEEKKAQEKKSLEERGEWDKLKAQMAEEHAKATEGYKSEIVELKQKLANESNRIVELTIGSAFNGSSYLKDHTILPPNKARALWGSYFDVSETGEVVGYDKPRGVAGRTQLVDQVGNPLSFEKAIEKVIGSDPDAESFIRAPGAAGSGSSSKGNSTPAQKPTSKITSGLDAIRAGISLIGDPK